MADLFDRIEPADPPAIPGLEYRANYITAAEESSLVAAIDALPWDTSWQRRRQPYGESYGGGRRGEKPVAIPQWGRKLIARLEKNGIGGPPFNQMLVNEYLPGQGITLHRDYEPFDRVVVSLSLLSACVMNFRRVSDGQRESLLLEPRSLIILADEARYEWEHGIAPRKSDRWEGQRLARSRRISVTLRRRRD